MKDNKQTSPASSRDDDVDMEESYDSQGGFMFGVHVNEELSHLSLSLVLVYCPSGSLVYCNWMVVRIRVCS